MSLVPHPGHRHSLWQQYYGRETDRGLKIGQRDAETRVCHTFWHRKTRPDPQDAHTLPEKVVEGEISHLNRVTQR